LVADGVLVNVDLWREGVPGTTLTQSDEVRIMQLAQQNRLLFAPIYETYFDRVYAYCLRRTDSVQEAEDLCSLVFSRALAGLDLYRGGLVAAWLFQIAHNTVIKHYRARRIVTALDDIEELEAESDLEQVDDREVWQTLSKLVATLPDDQRELLALMLDAGLSSQEVGEIVGKSAGAVRVQFHRLLKQLRERYAQLSGEQTA
jgi:RNA polymerase sigma-70 factor (ECF subfamily)